MKKAILVNDYASVEELNKLFEHGYTVESMDDNGVYILKRDEKQPTTLIACNDSMIDVKKLSNGEHKAKQPHVRIEFDDIRDVPRVWVDGELIGRVEDDKPLVSLKVDWNTDTVTENHKGFDINYFDMTDGRGKPNGFHQGSVM